VVNNGVGEVGEEVHGAIDGRAGAGAHAPKHRESLLELGVVGEQLRVCWTSATVCSALGYVSVPAMSPAATYRATFHPFDKVVLEVPPLQARDIAEASFTDEMRTLHD